MRDGNGVMTLLSNSNNSNSSSNSTVYSGQWQQDVFVQGEIRYSNGDVYTGKVNQQYSPHLTGEYVIGGSGG